VVRQAGIQGSATLAGLYGRALARRGASRTLVVGPWLGEVGFELLYWIPFARRLVLGAGVPADRVLVLSRGGVHSWYGEQFGRYLDLYDLFEPDDLHARQRDRVETAGEKQMEVTRLDREALQRARRHLGEELVVLHPSIMFRRFRPVWMRRRTTGAVRREIAPRQIPTLPPVPGLPSRYAALKLYSSRCFPVGIDEAEALRAELSSLTGDLPVVTLSAGADVDDHPDLIPVPSPSTRAELASNLRTQTALVQHAEMLVCTYGGFSYLGVLNGTPTVGLYKRANFNTLHLDVLTHTLEQLPTRPRAGFSVINIGHLPRNGRALADLTDPQVAYSFAPSSNPEHR
jgi:hypothetical protein